MDKIPDYSLTITALNNYRNGAKNDKNLDNDILKLKINCLIYASENCSLILGGKRYTFGTVIFEVSNDGSIKRIYWNTKNNKPSFNEISKLLTAYELVGLDRNGRKVINYDEVAATDENLK